MSNHGLTRNPDNEPVCLCGYRPEILSDPAPVGKQWKAQTAVLDHVEALKEYDDAIDKYLATRPLPAPTPLRSPNDPFVVMDARYPRAGVRRTEDGRWLLSCWDGDQIVHVIDEPVFDDRVTAFDYGFLTIGACRESGTNLNGGAA
ncbi:hypothetical protein AU252_19835 [Pseudarthrobacter sulfonivorans]|uniref:Uncharacterized protein n=1 Tax=Pseudarthrobacter sulfonivorans TaxID=121292 RepID=A0A0U3QNM6_9MICC|nr:hypothetical protein [Pseudarthrobacter sulfonivorans]ALV43131.1 hypothetical protein AU252_19835 [Pseudarthrobacter sulfonivorans]